MQDYLLKAWQATNESIFFLLYIFLNINNYKNKMSLVNTTNSKNLNLTLSRTQDNINLT